MKSLIIGDNQFITRIGFIKLASQEISWDKIYHCADKHHLLGMLVKVPSSVVVLDYTLFDFRSGDELLIMSGRFPQSHWILFSDTLSNNFLKKIVYADSIISIVNKMALSHEIATALQYAMCHKSFYCERTSQQLDNLSNTLLDNGKLQTLTSTEQEVLRAMALGKTTKEIAAERYLSFHTIMSHRKNIFRKLDVNNVHEATKYAIRAGLVDLAEYYI